MYTHTRQCGRKKKPSGEKELRTDTKIRKEAKSSYTTIFTQPLRVPERAPPPQWIWSLRYPLFSSFQAARLRHLVLLRPGGGGILVGCLYSLSPSVPAGAASYFGIFHFVVHVFIPCLSPCNRRYREHKPSIVLVGLGVVYS